MRLMRTSGVLPISDRTSLLVVRSSSGMEMLLLLALARKRGAWLRVGTLHTLAAFPNATGAA